MESFWNFGVVTLRLEDRVGWVIIDVPGKLNVVCPEMISGLNEALSLCEANNEIHVVVVSGDDKAFIAGNDIRRLANAGVAGAREAAALIMEPQERLANLTKPTIAALAGYVLGAGLDVALCCDFRIAADSAKLGFPEINIGIIPGGGGTQRLPRIVGVNVATQMIMLGETISADEAHRIGLVDRIVPYDQLRSETASLAAQLAEKAPLALWAAKKAIRASTNLSLAEGLQLEHGFFCALFGTEDQREGMTAFLEKRKPRFKGH